MALSGALAFFLADDWRTAREVVFISVNLALLDAVFQPGDDLGFYPAFGAGAQADGPGEILISHEVINAGFLQASQDLDAGQTQYANGARRQLTGGMGAILSGLAGIIRRQGLNLRRGRRRHKFSLGAGFDSLPGDTLQRVACPGPECGQSGPKCLHHFGAFFVPQRKNKRDWASASNPVWLDNMASVSSITATIQ